MAQSAALKDALNPRIPIPKLGTRRGLVDVEAGVKPATLTGTTAQSLLCML